MKISRFIITLLLFLVSIPVFSQSGYDTTKHEAQRIRDTYKRCEHKYIEIAKEKLLYYLNQDITLKKQYLSGDSTKLNNLKLILTPRLNLNYEARNYNYGENISKYFDLDTNNLIIGEASFCKNDTLIFSLKPLPTDCDLSEFIETYAHHSRVNSETGYVFYNFINDYKSISMNKIRDSNFCNNFNFEVNGLGIFFIQDSALKKSCLDSDCKMTNINFDAFMKNIFESKYEPWIRYCARRCPFGGNSWWRFWNWQLFLWKLKVSPDELEPGSLFLRPH